MEASDAVGTPAKAPICSMEVEFPASVRSAGSISSGERGQSGKAAEVEGKLNSYSSQGSIAEAAGSRLISTRTATFNMILATMGVGAFVLPEIARDAGLILAILTNGLVAYASYEGAALFANAMVEWNTRIAPAERLRANAPDGLEGQVRQKITSYETFGEAAFGQRGRYATLVCNSLSYMGVCCIYVVSVGNYFATVSGLADNFDLATVRLFFIPVYIGLMMMPDLSTLSVLAPVGLLASLLIPTSILIKSALDMGETADWEKDPAYPLHNMLPSGFFPLGKALGVIFGCWGYVGMTPTQANEMSSPEQLPIVAKFTSGIVFVLYSLVAVLGYMAVGNFVCEDYPDNMRSFPGSLEEAKPVMDGRTGQNCADGWTGKQSYGWYAVGVASVVFQNIMGYPLVLMTPLCALQELPWCMEKCPVGSWGNRVLRLCLVLTTALVGYFLPTVSLAAGFFCSLTSPVNTFILPALFSWRIRDELGMEHPGQPRLLLHMFLIVFCILTVICGVSGSIEQIMAAGKNGGGALIK